MGLQVHGVRVSDLIVKDGLVRVVLLAVVSSLHVREVGGGHNPHRRVYSVKCQDFLTNS